MKPIRALLLDLDGTLLDGRLHSQSIVESTPKSHLLIKQEVLNLKCEKAAGMQMYKKQKTGDRTDV